MDNLFFKKIYSSREDYGLHDISLSSMSSLYKEMKSMDGKGKIDKYFKNMHRNSKAKQFEECDEECKRDEINRIPITDPLDALF